MGELFSKAMLPMPHHAGVFKWSECIDISVAV